jgi:hypothetical protein
MKFAGVQDIKKELALLSPKKLQELCLKMAKYKKENKELLAFLLFESDDKSIFINELKNELGEEFAELSKQNNLFYSKKGLRRILRLVNRYIKYIDDKTLALDLLIWYCAQILEHRIPVTRSKQLENIYLRQLAKIETLIRTVHEDVQQDYTRELESLKAGIR